MGDQLGMGWSDGAGCVVGYRLDRRVQSGGKGVERGGMGSQWGEAWTDRPNWV